MSKLLIIGDLHLHNWKYPIVREYQDYLLKTKIKDLVYAKEPDTVVFMGDIFHDKRFVDKQILSEFMSMMYDLHDVPFVSSIHVVVGNHDLYHGQVSLDFLKSNKIHVHDKLAQTYFNGSSVIFIPYTELIQKGNNLLTNLQNLLQANCAETVFIFSHVDITEVPYLPSTYLPQELSLSIKSIISDKCNIFWINGHYHTPSTLKEGNVQYLSVGSVFGFTASDKNQNKSFVFVDLNKKPISFLNFEFIPTQAPMIKVFTDKKEYEDALEHAKDLNIQPVFMPVVMEPMEIRGVNLDQRRGVDLDKLVIELMEKRAQEYELNIAYGKELLEKVKNGGK